MNPVLNSYLRMIMFQKEHYLYYEYEQVKEKEKMKVMWSTWRQVYVVDRKVLDHQYNLMVMNKMKQVELEK
jgi:hypothetical protein